MFSNSSKTSDNLLDNEDFFGFCDEISFEFSTIYNKNVIFWPCPKMMVSSIESLIESSKREIKSH
jgi:hypothetical protein